MTPAPRAETAFSRPERTARPIDCNPSSLPQPWTCARTFSYILLLRYALIYCWKACPRDWLEAIPRRINNTSVTAALILVCSSLSRLCTANPVLMTQGGKGLLRWRKRARSSLPRDRRGKNLTLSLPFQGEGAWRVRGGMYVDWKFTGDGILAFIGSRLAIASNA